MPEFQREERYRVFKLSKLAEVDRGALDRPRYDHARVKCVVVESKWPIYEDVWDMVQRMAEDRPQKADELAAQLTEARADERQAMHYLESVRQAAGHDGDFPSLIQAVLQLRRDAEGPEKRQEA